MLHSEIYEQFKQYFPIYSGKNALEWFPHGQNCIRVRQRDRRELIFTFHSSKDWKLETLDMFFGGKGE